VSSRLGIIDRKDAAEWKETFWRYSGYRATNSYAGLMKLGNGKLFYRKDQCTILTIIYEMGPTLSEL
jgi:hypothetical protein